jgi:EmrB/QacA subfamily drug resistance transporter
MAILALGSAGGKWIMSACILASAMAFIDATALNVVLPSLQQSLQAKGTDLFWILNAYLLMLAAFVLPGGSLGDKLGRKKVFMIGIFVFILGSVACGLSTSVNMLIAFRAVQGLGGALMIPGSLSIISASFSDKERGKAIGTWSAITTMVTIGGPILGGALADKGLWTFIFFINVPIGIASLLILWFKVKESRDPVADNAIDYPGALTTVIGLALITFGFLQLPNTGFKDWRVVLSLIAGLLLLTAFVFIERNSKHPMIPLQLFTNKTFTGANLLTFFLYAGLGAGILFLTLNMVQVQGYSQLQAGLTFLPFTILMITVSRLSGTLTDKYGPRLLLISGPAVAGVGLFLLSFVKQTAGFAEYWSSFFPGILVFGLGMSFTVTPLTTTVMGSVANHFSGTASGVNNAISRIAGVFANAIFGALAILLFTTFLQKAIVDLPLSPETRQAVMHQTVNLGDATVPTTVNTVTYALIEKQYKNGFIAAYAVVMRICALLAFLGALMSMMFIKNEAVKVNDKETKAEWGLRPFLNNTTKT